VTPGTNLRRITAVVDDSSRQVLFGGDCTSSGTNPGNGEPLGPWGGGPYGCHTFEVTTPDGKITKYSYDTVAASPQASTAARPNYRLRRWFAPDDSSVPFLTFDFDSMYRVKGIVDKSGARTQYFSAGLYGREHQARGETVDPLLAATTQYFNQYGQLVSTIDPLARTRWKTYDDRQRLRSEIQPEGNSVEYTYDVRSNVLSEVRRPKSGSAWMPLTRTYTYVEGPTVTTCANAASCNLVASVSDYKARTDHQRYHSGAD
jgi:YD repeat-containing protein